MDLTITFPVSAEATSSNATSTIPYIGSSKALSIKIGRDSLFVGFKDAQYSPAIIDGKLSKAVKVDDSTWTFDQKTRELSIHLEKVNAMEWWDCVIQGHPKIDTTKILPENSKLSDLDGETRAMVEKMMASYYIK